MITVIPENILANADDLGLNNSINEAILFCFKNNYINSTSLLTNTDYFDHTIKFIHENPIIYNIGIHVNFATGKPVTNFAHTDYLEKNGDWNFQKTNKKITFLSNSAKDAFIKEIDAQMDKALTAKISINHIDSHFHLHTLPCFYNLFIKAAKKHNLKIRLAQTYSEGNFLKYRYRTYINNLIKSGNDQYADYFETVSQFLKTDVNRPESIELMFHPDIDAAGKLTDHYDKRTMTQWLSFLKKNDAFSDGQNLMPIVK